MIRYNVERDNDRYVVAAYRVTKSTSCDLSEYLHRAKDESGNVCKFWTETAAQELANKLTKEARDEA